MKLLSIAAACLAIASFLVTATAHAGQLSRVQSTQAKASIAEANGSASSAQADFSFRAQSYLLVDGERGGFIAVDAFGSAYQFIQCNGPEFADAVSINQSTGAVTVKALLDPANPSCYAFGYEGPALTLNFTGTADGNTRKSESGTGTERLFATVTKYNFQSDTFGQVFSGTTGLYTGVFTGNAISARSTNRTQAR